MARPPRYIWRIVFQNFINSFKSRQSAAQLKGEDNLGNKYFEALPTASSTRSKPSRYYMPAKGEEDFMQDLPPEWESWLRGRRKLPPTPEEIAANYDLMMLKKENAKELEIKRVGAKALESPEPPKGYQSFPKYGTDSGLEVVPGKKQGHRKE